MSREDYEEDFQLSFRLCGFQQSPIRAEWEIDWSQSVKLLVKISLVDSSSFPIKL